MATIPEALNTALQHHQAGRLQEAEALYRQILQTQPEHPEVLNHLGILVHQLGQSDVAVDYILRAIALRPQVPEFRYNLGKVLQERGRPEEAQVQYREALRLNPEYADAWNNLGNVLRAQGRPEEAVASYRQAQALNPAYAQAYYNLSVVLGEQGRPEEAVRQCERALSLNPNFVEAENQLMHQSQHLCEWSRFEELVERQKQRIHHSPASIVSPYAMLCVPCSPAEQLLGARNWAGNCFSPVARLREGLGFRFARAPKPRLRLGYLSADFREHAMAYLIAELFELHDRNSFEVFAYSYGPDDDGNTRKRIARSCDRFVDIAAESFQNAARQIYGDGVDILLDLQGYTGAARSEIVALRPAPIQVNYPGYAGTMGADFIDYIVTDRFVTPPDQQAYFTEKCVYLPDCYLPTDRTRKIAEWAPARKECGLPEEGVVLCCFNSPHKIIPSVFNVWMRVLKEVPASVLWLLESNSGVSANLRREAKAQGVDPKRLVFAPKISVERHIARFRVASLFLDTLPYNAHTTASEALWVGLPVLTCSGETFASRVAGSLLRAIGLPELVTTSLAEYEAAAVRLAGNPAELKALRDRLAKNRLTMPLFDSARYTRHLERAYRMMWDRYARGEAPGPIEVPNQ